MKHSGSMVYINMIIYYSMVKLICVICLILDLCLYIYGIFLSLKKQNNQIYVSRYIFWILALISIFPHFIFIISNYSWQGTAIDSIIGLFVFEIFINISAMVLMWICLKYKIIIAEDKFIIYKPIIGKKEILFENIDKRKSAYQFITYKRKGFLKHNTMINHDEQLLLYFNDGASLCLNLNFFIFSGDNYALFITVIDKLKLKREQINK